MRKISFQADIDGGRAAKQLERLKQKILKLEDSLAKAQGDRNAIAEKMDEAAAKADATRDKVAKLKTELADANQRIEASKISGTPTLETERAAARYDSIKAQLKEQEAILKSQVREAEAQYKAYDRVDSKVQSITRDLERQQAAAGGIEQKLSRTFDSARLREAGQQLNSSLKGGLKTLLKYGLGMRSIYVAFRALRTAAIEGVKEMAQYDASTNKAISNIKNAATAFKAGVASAFSQVLQIIEPVLTRIINLITKAINYIGMFFAALRGAKNYKKAIATQTDYAKAIGATGAAAKEATKYLSGLDEVQRYDSGSNNDSSSSGAGGSIVDGLEEVEIPENLQKVTSWIRDHLNEIKDAALGVGAAILAWKIASNFTNDFKTLFGVGGILAGAVIYVKEFADAWKNGVDLDNLKGMLAGVAIAAVAAGIAFGGIAAGIVILMAGIGLLILYIHENWDEIKAWAREAKQRVYDFFTRIGEAVSQFYTEKVAPWFTRERWATLAQDAKSGLEAQIKPKTEAVKQWYEEKVAPWLTVDRWRQAGSNALQSLKTAIQEISWWHPISDWFSQQVRPWFTADKWRQLGNDAINGIRNGLHQITIPKFHLSWGWDYRSFNVLGQSIGMYIPWPQLSFYSRGGIVDGATYLGGGKVAGEEGKEAIVPLERHTEWLDMVADRLAELLTDRLGAFFARTPLPAVATGSLVPPRISVELTGINDLRGDMQRLSDALLRQRGGDYRFTAQLNRRTLFDEIIDEGRLRQAATGKNPFDVR